MAEIFKPRQQLKLWQEKRTWFAIPLPPLFLLLKFKGEKMIRCVICGAAIKPWFEVCYQCYNPISRNAGAIPEPIITKEFMKNMEIDRW
ncbi:hypothetical protein J4480_03455 [Candidatus Woesearchaeota archaeon]|nr:hypothetical protein [Candidatus Woesearchaeota archaeon]